MPSIAVITSPTETDFQNVKYFAEFDPTLQTVLLEIKELTIDQADRAA